MGDDIVGTCCMMSAIAGWVRYIESAILRFKGVGLWMNFR